MGNVNFGIIFVGKNKLYITLINYIKLLVIEIVLKNTFTNKLMHRKLQKKSNITLSQTKNILLNARFFTLILKIPYHWKIIKKILKTEVSWVK